MSPLASKTYLPEEEIAGRFAQIVEAMRASSPALVTEDGTIPLGPELSEILAHVASALSQGRAVSVIPQCTMLTTQEAADILGISRPTLVRLLEEGQIPFTKPGRHRRVRMDDLLEYQERQRAAADEALTDMVADSEYLGDYDLDPTEVGRALEAARKDRRS